MEFAALEPLASLWLTSVTSSTTSLVSKSWSDPPCRVVMSSPSPAVLKAGLPGRVLPFRVGSASRRCVVYGVQTAPRLQHPCCCTVGLLVGDEASAAFPWCQILDVLTPCHRCACAGLPHCWCAPSQLPSEIFCKCACTE